jgi:hypothetical protein
MIGSKIIMIMVGIFISSALGLVSVNHLLDTTPVSHVNSQDNFHQEIINKAIEVNNSVEATLAGQENPADALNVINEHLAGSQLDSKYSMEQREINNRYKKYLESAYTTVVDKIAGTGNVTVDVAKMNENFDNI